MIRYKIDVLKELNNKGYNTYRLRKNVILGENVIQNLFSGFGIKINTINNNQGLPYININKNGEE